MATSEKQVESEKNVSILEGRASLAKYEHDTDSSISNPLAQFSEDEVKRAWRKVDWHILPVAVLLYLSSYIDR